MHTRNKQLSLPLFCLYPFIFWHFIIRSAFRKKNIFGFRRFSDISHHKTQSVHIPILIAPFNFDDYQHHTRLSEFLWGLKILRFFITITNTHLLSSFHLFIFYDYWHCSVCSIFAILWFGDIVFSYVKQHSIVNYSSFVCSFVHDMISQNLVLLSILCLCVCFIFIIAI